MVEKEKSGNKAGGGMIRSKGMAKGGKVNGKKNGGMIKSKGYKAGGMVGYPGDVRGNNNRGKTY
jgi:hypothetical protein|tara:strand:+ start:422 stop:613 length:192 start_codon:yes stop_codon:yes gene_type:complete